MAAITEGAGFLIAAVRALVRDAIATLVSRLLMYAAEEVASFGVGTPLVVEQATTLYASWTAKIGRWLRGLLSSLRELGSLGRRLGQAIEYLRNLLNKLRGRDGLPDQERDATVPPHVYLLPLDPGSDDLDAS
jgi:hypothetical protein